MSRWLRYLPLGWGAGITALWASTQQPVPFSHQHGLKWSHSSLQNKVAPPKERKPLISDDFKDMQVGTILDRPPPVRAQHILTRLLQAASRHDPSLRASLQPRLLVGTGQADNVHGTLAATRIDTQDIALNAQLVFMSGNDEDTLALILAHELGHILCNHLWVRRTRAAMLTPLPQIVSLTGSTPLQVMLEGILSMNLEREADFVGLHLMSAAGYNPARALRGFEHIYQRWNIDTGFGERIEEMRSYLSIALKYRGSLAS